MKDGQRIVLGGEVLFVSTTTSSSEERAAKKVSGYGGCPGESW